MNRVCIHPQPADRLRRFVLLTAASSVSLIVLSGCGTTAPTAANDVPPAIASPAATAASPTALPPTALPATPTAPVLSGGPPDDTETIVTTRARQVIQALAAQDMSQLATFVDPQRGLRFSPYAYVLDEQVVISQAQVPDLMQDATQYVWGYQDGSGLPIAMTFEAYYAQYVYTRDFANAPQVSMNERLGQGNTIDNSREYYPASLVVEYHVPSAPEQFDWQSLRLVFQENAGTWYLVGIIHDQWTI